MPRQSRTKSESGIYHVMFRGNNKQVIFEDDFDRMKFISLLSEFQENEGRGCFTLYSYCLMTNHVHLLYRETGDDVQRSMKRIATSYALYFNKKYGRVGHLFQDRFRSEPCEDMEYFVTLIRYIHQNPVKAHISKDVSGYEWSSWHEFEQQLDDGICDVATVLKRCPMDELREMVGEMLPDDVNCLDIKSESYVRRSDDYVVKLVKKLFPGLNMASVQRAERQRIVGVLRGHHVACDQIARATGLSYDQVNRIFRRLEVEEKKEQINKK